MYFLRIDADTLEDSTGWRSKARAIAKYRAVASELARYGQTCEATVHIAPSRDEIAEYPDFVLTLTERGAVRVESA